MSIITPQGVADAMGATLTPETPKQYAFWIAGAERIIQLRLGDLDRLDQDDLAYVITEAVILRAGRPADGATSWSVSVDDGTTSRKWDAGHRGIVILDEWWDLLRPRLPSRPRRVGTIWTGSQVGRML